MDLPKTQIPKETKPTKERVLLSSAPPPGGAACPAQRSAPRVVFQVETLSKVPALDPGAQHQSVPRVSIISFTYI